MEADTALFRDLVEHLCPSSLSCVNTEELVAQADTL